jgi:CRP-like cAMP-binding protein
MPPPPHYTFEFASLFEHGEFERVAQEEQVRKGKPVIDQGHSGTDVYFITEGRFKVLSYSPNGRQVDYRILDPGDHFGELAALTPGPRTASVVAETHGTLVKVSAKDFRDLLEASPQASLWLARRFASQIRVLTERVFELSAHSVSNRIRAELLRLARPFVGDNQARIKPAPRQHEIANRLATQREAVSREFSHLRKLGLIARSTNELVILDVAGLERLLQRASGEEVGGTPSPKSPSGRRRKR